MEKLQHNPENFDNSVDVDADVDANTDIEHSVTESALGLGQKENLEAPEELDRSRVQNLGNKVLGSEERDKWRRQSSFVQAETEPDYEQELTEPEKLSHPELRFDVNPDRFPILRDQKIDNQLIDINETLSLLTQDTADTVAFLSGETNPSTRKSDAVIYLDKSARPVSWLVDEMWTDFTDQPRPEREEFLAIDRVNWFRAIGLNVSGNGNLKESTGLGEEGRRATHTDFRTMIEQNPVSRSDLARARLALIPGGVARLREAMDPDELVQFDSYNPLAFESRELDQSRTAPELPEWIVDKIFATPTGLEGKKVTIIDEVASSGATLGIAKDIVAWAINDPTTEIAGHTFWHAGTKQTTNNEAQMLSAPVWYNHDLNSERGKGIGDVNFRNAREKFAEQPNLETLNQLYIAPFRGRALDMEGKEGESSVELQEEFRRLAKIYRDGGILMAHPRVYDEEKWIDRYEQLGVEFTRDPKVKNSYVAIKKIFQEKAPQG